MTGKPRDNSSDERPDAAQDHPSVLALLCSDEPAPQPLEVLQRIENAGYRIEVLSEDGPPDALWSRMLRLDSAPEPLFISCRPRLPTYRPWEAMPARWRDEAEYEQARVARWMVLLETIYPPDDEPNLHYHSHLQLADSVANGLASACIDLNSSVLRSATTLHQVATCQVPPAPEEMYEIEVVSRANKVWLHTHGLRRFDVPELELIGVPAKRWRDAYTALQWLVATLLPVYVPASGMDLEIGAKVRVRLMPLWPMLAMLPHESLGGAGDRDARHDGWRMLVSDIKRDGSYSIQRFLRSVSGDPVFWLSPDESLRRANLARVRFGHAAAAWYSRQWRKRRMGIKVGVPFNDVREDLTHALGIDQLPPGAGREHMWFELQSIEGKTLVAKLESEPVYATYLAKGETYRLPITQLSEFNLTLDDQNYNPATISELDVVTLRTGK